MNKFDNLFKLSDIKTLLKAVTVSVLLIVTAFIVNRINPFNAYYIKPIEYCIALIFISFLLEKVNKFHWLIKLIALYNAVTLTYLELEMWAGNNLAEPFDGLEMMHIRLVINWFLILAVIFLATFIFGNIKRGIYASSIGFTILGFFNFLVVEFRGEELLPTDIVALKTAANVAESYQIPFRSNIFAALLCFLTILLWAHLIKNKSENLKQRNCKRLLFGLLSLWCFWSFNTFEFEKFYYPWFVPNNGYIFAVATNLKLLNIKPDINYSNMAVRETIVENSNGEFFPNYSAEEAIKEQFPLYEGDPNIICIMNESFSYLPQFTELFETDKEIAPFINSIKDSTIQGDLVVEVFGGGTSDTEFTFFTGLSTKLFPTNARAYELYINERTPSLVKNLKSQGYETIAIHPDKAENWNRDEVYPYLGFDEFLTEENFEEPEIIRDIFTSDRETYRTIEKLYENKGDNPLFVFDLTIQNHGSYDQSFNNLEKVNLLNPDSNNYPKLEQYLSLIRESDKAFGELIEFFNNVNEPTIICMFGDHLAKLDPDLYTEIFNTEESKFLETQRLQYTTPFIIWANYKLPPDTLETMSINYLSTALVELSGTKKTPFNSYLANLYQNYPVIDKKGILDKNYNSLFYDSLTSKEEKDIIDYNNIIYNYLFEKDPINRDLYSLE